MEMAGKYLMAALLGLALAVCNCSASDIVYDDKMAVPVDMNPIEFDTSVGYTRQEDEQEVETAPLSCYDCTSYMSSCKREVRDVGGQIVSRTGCKTKCFLRVGEEQSGALYRGCMDDFLSATSLTQDYVGCRVQEWNGKKSLWCLCGDDLCNGQSLKALFYYGFGRPNKVQYLPDGKAYLVESVDDRFDAMTRKVHNYNRQYEEEFLPEEPLYEATSIPREELRGEATHGDGSLGYSVHSRPVEDLQEPEQLLEQLPYVEELPGYEAEQYRDDRGEEPESYGEVQPGTYEEHPYGYETEEHHSSLAGDQPAYPSEQFREEHPGTEQYASEPEAIPPYYQYPQYPGLSSQFKYPGEEIGSTAAAYPEGPADREPLADNGVQTESPEGKSAVLPSLEPEAHVAGHGGGPFPAFPPRGYYAYPSNFGYPYHYGGELEPLNYSPPENELDQEEVEVEKQHDVGTEPAAKEYTEEILEPQAQELDSELYCPAAGIFTYEEDCSKFVMCLIDHIHGKPRMYVMKCPANLVFDSIANTCMQPEMSDGCKRLPAPIPVVTSEPELHERPGRSESYGSEGYEASKVNQVFDYGY